MKKSFLTIIVAATLLSGCASKSQSFNKNKFGEGALQGGSIAAKSIANGALQGAAKGGLVGLGIGVVYGILDPIIMDRRE